MGRLTLISIVVLAGLVISFSAVYELTTSPSSPPSTQALTTASPLTGLKAEILDPPTRAAPGEELLLRVRVYKPEGLALPSAQLYAYLYCYQLGLGGCLNAGPGDWRDWVINRVDITVLDPAYRSAKAHENIFELKLGVKENALEYLKISGVADVSLRARLRVPCNSKLDENGENVKVTIDNQNFSVQIMDKSVYTSETKYSLMGQGANPSVDLSSKGHVDIDFTIRGFLIGEALAPEPSPKVLPLITDLRVELLNAPTGVRPGDEFSFHVRVSKPAGMIPPNAQLYTYLYCPRLGLQGCLNSAPEGFIDWTANAINITALDPNFRRTDAHENTFEFRIKVKENALNYLNLQGANYVRLRARLRIQVNYSSVLQGISIKMGNQSFTSPVLVEKQYEGETQYYLSDELKTGNDIHVGSRGNLDYDATVTVVLSEGGQLSRVEQALQYVSRAYNIPETRLIPGNEQYGELRTLELEFWRVGVMDPITGESYDVYTDAAGNIVSGRELREREKQASWQKYGKLSVDLHDYLENMNADEKVKVGIWLADVNARNPRPRPSEAITQLVENTIVAATDNFKNVIKLREKPVVDALGARGLGIIYASQYAPLIFAEVPKRVVLELENRSDVVQIYRSLKYAPAMDVASKAERAPEVWNKGITGSDVKVAIVEPDEMAINPYYSPPIYRNYMDIPSMHSTMVAGIVACTCSNFPSNGKDYRGVAFGIPRILDAEGPSWNDYDIIPAVEWALSNGANVLNNSYQMGPNENQNLQLQLMDIYFDYIVEVDFTTVIVSAGNRGVIPGDGNVNSPGLGYDVITVGAFNDSSTVDWSDDTMASFSSWRNPSNALGQQREKPEVVAVGCHGDESPMYVTLTDEPWIGQVDYPYARSRGTSLAAPAVAGEAALLMQRANWLKYWPEAVKAVIMASADHPIVKTGRQNGLSDKDGAGAIDCAKADNVVQKGWLSTCTCYGPSSWNNWNYQFYASAGETVRVVLCWNSYAYAPSLYDELKCDFNLNITNQRGDSIAFSDSRGRTFQMVEFHASYTGNYTVKVTINRWDQGWSFEDLALAYCRV
jgi:subtilisin family serine protease